MEFIQYKRFVSLANRHSHSLSELGRIVADITFICDPLNSSIYFSILLSMIGSDLTNYYLKTPNWFHIQFYKHNYSSASFFPRILPYQPTISICLYVIKFFFIF